MATNQNVVNKVAKAAMITGMKIKAAGKAQLTEGLYELLPKPPHYPVELHSVTANGKTAIVDQKKIVESVKHLNGIYKKTKDITLHFIAIVPLSQEVVVPVGGKRVRTKVLGMITPYNWKARYFDVAVAGWDQLSEEEQRKTRDRFDRGIVAFSKQYKLRYIVFDPKVAEEKTTKK